MTEDAVYDVVVVGGGIAGMTAANRAAELGLRTVVLEQGQEQHYLCNSRFTGGTFHTCFRDPTVDETVLQQTIEQTTAGFVTAPLAAMVAREGRRVVRWLQKEGARFIKASPAEYHQWVLAPPARTKPGLEWKGRSGDVLLGTLESNLVRRKGELIRNTRARSLIMDGARCTGVMALTDGQERKFSAKAVVLADGGYQGNPELVARYISKHPERLKQRGAGTGCGDGLQMAIAAGAATIGLDRFYGHVLSRDAMTNDSLWPYPYLDSILVAGVVIEGNGRRFVDEGRGGVFVANAIAQLPNPFSAAIIFDQTIWDGPGKAGLIPANPHLPAVGGTLLSAPNLESLAALLGIPGTEMARTILNYNNSLKNNELDEIEPRRRTAKYKAMPIATAPFYAAPACAGITNTMGGIAINEHGQALREGAKALSGLYAAGAAAGGLEGGPELGYVGGLIKCGTTGMVAAEHIATTLGIKTI